MSATISNLAKLPNDKSYALFLRADHAEVKRIFGEFARAESDADRRRWTRVICMQLAGDATIQEEIVYPSVSVDDEPLYDSDEWSLSSGQSGKANGDRSSAKHS